MRICKKCKVEILDDTTVCPLCSSVLEISGEEGKKATGYPDVKAASRRLNFVVQLYSFLAIIIETALVIVNYLTFDGVWWSIITGVTILYFYITLKYSLKKNTGYKAVILTQVIGALVLVIVADNVVGYRGWSVNYVMPGAILLLDATIAILMLVNTANWQSYILMQIFTVLSSIAALILWWMGIVTRPFLSCLAAAVSGSMLLGTLIFGERRAKTELKRRFHV